MAINRDNSDLPRAQATEFPPDEIPRFGMRLAESWALTEQPDNDKPHAVEGTTFRLSWAGKCARDLGYSMRRLDLTDPPTVADHWRMGLGTMIHEHFEDAIKDAFPGALLEHKVDLREQAEHPIDGSGHIDVYIATDPVTDKRTVVEIKTVNGYSFKMSTGAFSAPAEGPKAGHFTQACLEADAVDADEMVIVYLSLELLSPQFFKKIGGLHETQKFVAEWTYTHDEYRPVAEFERKRVAKVIEMVEDDLLPPRSIPGLPTGSRIVDPERGNWTKVVDGQIVEAGSTWQCGYCWHRARCIEDGAT